MAKWRMFFRRSIGNRYARLNFTKRGFGYSLGLPSLRHSRHSTGRVTDTAGIPGSGLYWRRTTSMRNERPAGRRQLGGSVEEALALSDEIDREPKV